MPIKYSHEPFAIQYPLLYLNVQLGRLFVYYYNNRESVDLNVF